MLHEENPSGNSMKTDVYAFAITMYEVLNDAKPVWVTTDGQPMRDRVIETQVCKGNRPKRIDNIPDDIWTMVERCWHQVPDQRPTFVEILGWLEPFKALHSPPEPKPRSTQGADSHPSASSQDARTPTPRQRESESYPGVSRLMLQRARKGDPDACLLVAKTITSSKDTTSTGWAEAATFLQTAADHESLDAYFYLGWMYFLGLGVQQSDLDALEYWREVSTRSTDPISKPIATHMLGWLLYLGRGTAPDIGKGIMLIRQSKTSEFGLGEDELMSSDTLISSDSATAAHFFHLCQLGLEHQWLCKHLVGVCYVHGFGSAQDQQRAADLFEELAGQGHDTSQYWLGKCLDRGWGRPIDVPAKYKWYLAAAEGGNSYAQNMIGRMHEVGSHVSKDDSCAAKWYRKSAEQGNKFGQNNLGWCYQAGCGVGQDPSVAIEWYRKSAEQGHSSGQNNLGACFFNGCGVASDLPKAIEWYQKSAEQGNVYAQWNLALNYEYGNGIEKDMATALSWYRKAAENGHSSASDRLQVLSP
ncbi:uncharacterized protein BJ171DRAFT_503807 [Polychytrium aggregatum]|uniref:uncharacterized protein n=1 Tax=Polychytrium aggregatum TaxID=110093 RepID=UPI0022FE3163|nr:uncharacterized protein BJ171DRAFT_503807 [Polychytrium aggregatum]KAI9204835.1 hypothetical protein BJ171DRAFT_503807 [Polychytrium aggregatum]